MQVIGVDLNAEKVRIINEGRSPIIEDQLEEMIADAVGRGKLRAVSDAAEAVRETDLSVISVGTPSDQNGAADLGAVRRVSEQIGCAIGEKSERHTVVVRSTVMPGTVRSLVIPAIEQASGKRCGDDFGVCFNPEFLREGSSVRDHYDPPFTLIGQDSDRDGDAAARLYAGVNAPVIRSSIETAEMVKYVCNAFHALKATFANEIGSLARTLGVDSRQVMEIVCRDTKLNISPKYLKPGFAFGGSCLPKDVRALVHKSREKSLELPLLASIMASNRMLVERAVSMILQRGRRKVSMLGISFKARTDDLRESPNVAVAEALIGKGYDVRIYDRNISLARLVGANKTYIEKEIPHIASLMTDDLAEAVNHGELIIIGNTSAEFSSLGGYCRPGQVIIDLAGVDAAASIDGVEYVGVTW